MKRDDNVYYYYINKDTKHEIEIQDDIMDYVSMYAKNDGYVSFYIFESDVYNV